MKNLKYVVIGIIILLILYYLYNKKYDGYGSEECDTAVCGYDCPANWVNTGFGQCIKLV